MNPQRIIPHESEMLSEMTREMGWDIFYDQLETGRFGGSIDFAGGRHTQFFKERYSRSVCVHGAVPQEMATFIIVKSHTGGEVFRGEKITRQTLCALMPGDEGALGVPADAEFLTCCMEGAYLNTALESLHLTTLAEVLPRTTALQASAGNLARLLEVIETACDPGPNSQQLVDRHETDAELEELAVQLLLGALVSEEPATASLLAARNHWRYVRKAREFIEDNLGSTLRVGMLCRHTGVTERTLEHAFRNVTGYSTKQFIKVRRLNIARHKLMNSSARETSVKEVALTSGFTHLGYFSRDYYARFGELPSATLAD